MLTKQEIKGIQDSTNPDIKYSLPEITNILLKFYESESVQLYEHLERKWYSSAGMIADYLDGIEAVIREITNYHNYSI